MLPNYVVKNYITGNSKIKNNNNNNGNSKAEKSSTPEKSDDADILQLDLDVLDSNTPVSTKSYKHLVHPSDTYNDIINKIALQIGISPEYVYLSNGGKSLDFTVYLNGILDNNLFAATHDHDAAKDTLGGIPINTNVYSNQDNLSIHVHRQPANYSGEKLYVGLFTEALEHIVNIRPEDIRLIYYGFVVIYFPKIGIELFQELLKITPVEPIIPRNISENYSFALTNNTELHERYSLIDTWYKSGVNISDVVNDKVLRTNINTASVTMRSPMALSPYFKMINLKALFDATTCDKQITFCTVSFIVKNQVINLQKFVNDDKIYGETVDIVKQLAPTLPNNSYSQLIYINSAYYLLTIRANLEYTIQTASGDQNDVERIKKDILRDMKSLLQGINNRNRSIFSTDKRLPALSYDNLVVRNISISYNWYSSISPDGFNTILGAFNKYLMRDVLERVDQMEYRFFPYTQDYDFSDYESEYSNQYTNYYNPDAMNYYKSARNGKSIVITYNFTHINFASKNLSENDAVQIFNFIKTILENVDLKSTPKEVTQSKISLKNLKVKDPELFMANRYGSKIVYSRKCQKNYQPLGYTPEELAQLDPRVKKQATKYWNFTTNSEMYYVCPNKAYPHLSFITGVHPKGYCLPCCRKTVTNTPNIVVDNKKYTTTAACLQFKSIYAEKSGTEKSRYVIHFGKKIEPGRLGKMPYKLDVYANKFVDDPATSITYAYNGVVITDKILEKIVELCQDSLDTKTVTLDELRNLKAEIQLNDKPEVVGYTEYVTNDVLYIDPIKRHSLIAVDGVYINPLSLFYQFSLVESDNITITYINITKAKINLFNTRINYAQTYFIVKRSKTDINTTRKSDKYTNIKQKKFYLLGVEQKTSAGYIGLLFIYAYYLNLSPEATIRTIAGLLGRYPKFRDNLYRKYFAKYYDTVDEFIDALPSIILADNMLNIDMNQMLLDIFTLLFTSCLLIVTFTNNNYYISKVNNRDSRVYRIILKHGNYYYPVILGSLRNFINNRDSVRSEYTLDNSIVASLVKFTGKMPYSDYVENTVSNTNQGNSKPEIIGNYIVYPATGTIAGYAKHPNPKNLGHRFNIGQIVADLVRYNRYAELHNVSESRNIVAIVCYDDQTWYLQLSDGLYIEIEPVPKKIIDKLASEYPTAFGSVAQLSLPIAPDAINAVIQRKPTTKADTKSGVSRETSSKYVMEKVWDIFDKDPKLISAIEDIFVKYPDDLDSRKKAIHSLIKNKIGFKHDLVKVISYDLALLVKRSALHARINLYQVYNYTTTPQTGDNIIFVNRYDLE